MSQLSAASSPASRRTATGIGSCAQATTSTSYESDSVSAEDADCADDACSAASVEEAGSRKVVLRRYCVIYASHVPDSYFEGGLGSPACQELAAIVARAAAQLAAEGYVTVLHKYTKGVPPFNLRADDAELWFNMPDAALNDVLAALGDLVEGIVEDIAC